MLKWETQNLLGFILGAYSVELFVHNLMLSFSLSPSVPCRFHYPQAILQPVSHFGSNFNAYKAALAKAAEQASAAPPESTGKKAPPPAKGAPPPAAEDIESTLPVPSKQVRLMTLRGCK